MDGTKKNVEPCFDSMAYVCDKSYTRIDYYKWHNRAHKEAMSYSENEIETEFKGPNIFWWDTPPSERDANEDENERSDDERLKHFDNDIDVNDAYKMYSDNKQHLVLRAKDTCQLRFLENWSVVINTFRIYLSMRLRTENLKSWEQIIA